MEEWLRNLPGELANEAVWTLLLVGAGWTWKNRDKLFRRSQHLRVTVTDRLGLSDSVEPKLHRIELSATATGTASLSALAQPRSRSSASGVLSVKLPTQKPSTVEELLWWYLRVR